MQLKINNNEYTMNYGFSAINYLDEVYYAELNNTKIGFGVQLVITQLKAQNVMALIHMIKAGTSTAVKRPSNDEIEEFIGSLSMEEFDTLCEEFIEELKKQPLTRVMALKMFKRVEKEMSEKEIENWEKKAKAGVLRNDNELRKFIEDMKGAVYGELEGLGISLSDIGINSVSDYNKPGQLSLDEEKFSKALKENGELVYKATTAGLEKIKKVTYNYAGSSGSVFAKKAGIEKTSTAVNNLFSEQIKKQEERIKELKAKMQERQEELYAKFASLESSMNTLNSQMNYLINSMSS